MPDASRPCRSQENVDFICLALTHLQIFISETLDLVCYFPIRERLTDALDDFHPGQDALHLGGTELPGVPLTPLRRTTICMTSTGGSWNWFHTPTGDRRAVIAGPDDIRE